MPGQDSAEWGSFVSTRVNDRVDVPGHGPHRRYRPHDGGAEYSHGVGVASVHCTGNAEFSVRGEGASRMVNGGPAAACSHLIIHTHAHSQFYHHSLQPQLARLAVMGELAWASCLVAAVQRGCRAGLEHLP